MPGKKTYKTADNIFRILRSLGSSVHHRTLNLIVLSILSSCAEAVSISLLLPFLTIILDPEYMTKAKYQLSRFLPASEIIQQETLQLIFAFIFILALFMATILRVYNLSYSTQANAFIGNTLATRLFTSYIAMPYEKFAFVNKDQIISDVSVVASRAALGIGVAFSLFTYLLTSIVLIALLLALKPSAVMIMSAIIIGFYILIYNGQKNQISTNSAAALTLQPELVQSITESILSFKDILIANTQNASIEDFRESDKEIRNKIAANVFLGQYPKWVIETLAISLMLAYATYLSQSSNTPTAALAPVAVIALTAQRLLPALQQVYSSLSSIDSYAADLELTARRLSVPISIRHHSSKRLQFSSHHIIQAHNILYDTDPLNSESFKLSLPHFSLGPGQFVSIQGPSGSGKSTLISLFLGFLRPTSGIITVSDQILDLDNSELLNLWWNSLSYVPQQTYLLKRNIAQNIAFGVSKDAIDYELLHHCAMVACIHEFVTSLPQGYQTTCSPELSLSGGQIQRIAIARALYRRPDLLILDECTSALDATTSYSIYKNIADYFPDLAILNITHRTESDFLTSHIIEITDGQANSYSTPSL